MIPKITVLMPVYNGEKYLSEAIESILNQTLKNFEFLIIDDGSTDNSVKIIKSYSDQRIRLIHNEKNLGLITTLNRGINLATEEYIARMDCDDVSLPERLATQVKFMDNHKEIGVCGSWIKTIGKNIDYKNKFFTKPEEIKTSLLFNTSLAHPSIIMRREMLLKYNLRYDINYPHAEDYELWSRSIKHFSLANIPKVLLLHRLHADAVSNQFSDIQGQNSIKIRMAQLKNIGINPTYEDIKTHCTTRPQNNKNIKEFIEAADQWLNKIKKAPKIGEFYTEPEFSYVLYSRWLTICQANTILGFWLFKRFWQSDLTKNIKNKKWGDILKFFIKCLIKKP